MNIRLTLVYFLLFTFLVLPIGCGSKQKSKTVFNPKPTYQFRDSLKGLWQIKSDRLLSSLEKDGLAHQNCRDCAIQIGERFGRLNSDYIREVQSNLRSLKLDKLSDGKLRDKLSEVLQESLELIENSSDGFLGETIMLNDSTPLFKSEILLLMKQQLDNCLETCLQKGYSTK